MAFSSIDEIKNRLDIVELVGGYIKLQKAGQNFKALCPFHSEKTPSFFVSPTRQLWHCFGGCSEGGDIFKFVMKIEGIEFGDALRLLAQKAGVELKKQDPKIRSERQRLYEVCELTAKFFEKQLEESKVGKEAKKYLLNRKINEKSLKKWRIGYAPDVWQGLSDFLFSQGYSQEEIKKAGLGLFSEKGSFYDRFRGRIIFPIFDLNSNIVGFTGRVFKNTGEDKMGKYVNTPQSLLYDKGRILYGLNRAKVEIRRKNVCILVEGNIDLIMLHQQGFENAVAVSGTALTPYQLNILKRYTDNLLISFDMDAAGQTAAKKGIDLAQAQGFNIKVVVLSQGKDPAEIISKNPKKWEKALEDAKTILDFYFHNAFSGKDLKNPLAKKEIAEILLPIIKRIPNKIEQAHWVQELARKLSVREEVIVEQLKNTKAKEREKGNIYFKEEKNSNLLPKSRKVLLEETVASLVLKNPEKLNLIEKEFFSYFSDRFQSIFTDLKKGVLPKDTSFIDFSFTRAIASSKDEASASSPTRASAKRKNEDLFSSLMRASVSSEDEDLSSSLKDVDYDTEIKICLNEIKRLEIKNKLDEISQNIKKAEQACDLKKVNSLTQEFDKLANKLLISC